ncbi:MAG TPA: CHAD domain-containing protein [Planctomycetota bacterium]|nr:CHAD domain-containing protein [Planctomycetota bacterium]
MREIEFKFTQSEPIPERMRRIYAALSTRIGEDGTDISHERIHDTRTNIKKLRALWHLIRPIVAKDIYERNNQRLRNAAHGLSPLRDPHMAAEQLEELVKRAASKKVRAACAHSLEVIASQNSARQPAAGEAREKLERVWKEMRESLRQFSKLDLDKDEWVLIGPGLQRMYRTARRRMKKARKNDDDHDFHNWRKAAKYYMYYVELLSFVWPETLEKEAERLKALEQALGEDHDLTMLAERLDQEKAAIGRDVVSDVLGEIDKRKKALRRQSLKDGEELFARKPKKLIAKIARHWQKARA